jgi:hypothetical protein
MSSRLPATPITFVHISTTKNIGDLFSAPYNYFVLSSNQSVVNIKDDLPNTSILVFGGGALGNNLKAIPGRVNIAWGVGFSRHGKKEAGPVPEGFALFGSREWNQEGAIYAPCASCMLPLFDLTYPITREAVLYVNSDPRVLDKYPVKLEGLPSVNNRNAIHEVISFLGSAETVVTNSYHGAYWATLLGRKVVLISAYSSKFHQLKFPCAVLGEESLNEAVCRATTHPEALEDARSATLKFRDSVLKVISEANA